MAAAPAEEKPKQDWSARVQWRPDKSGLVNDKFELIALLMFDGTPELDAWALTHDDKRITSGNTRQYFNRILANEVFQERLMALEEEKTALEQDPIWGDAAWKANQLYRYAVANLDLQTMKMAAKMSFDIAERRHKAAQSDKNESESTQNSAENDAETPEPKAPVGRPTVKNPQTKRDPGQVRTALLAIGRGAAPATT